VTQTPVAPAEPRAHAAAGRRPSISGPGSAAAQVAAEIAPEAAGRCRRSTTSYAGTLRAYVALTKPRIIELLLVTTLPAMILAAHGLPDWTLVVATMVGGTLAAGSANALNCYVDRDIDAIMRRTGHRPLARHDVSPRGALVFGLVLGLVAVVSMAIATNLLAAGLTFAAIAFYVVVYTMLLKRRTAQNIVWGGAAGCMPVLIGWAAVTDSLAWAPVVLFAVVFFWTPPHFWALAIRYRDDYARAGVPMLPVVSSPRKVAAQIVGYSWLTAVASLLLWPLATGWVYGVLAAAAGAVLVGAAHRLLARTRDDANAAQNGKAAMALFHLSNSYLAFVFVAVAVDTFLR
jgi:protoheme IX farnesyltransferase